MLAREEEINDPWGLWADRSFLSMRGPSLKRLAELRGVKVKSLSKELGVPRTSLYHEKVRVDGELRLRLLDLTRIISNAHKLFDGDESAVIVWLFGPNRRFFNMSPYEMALSGKGSTVYQHQEENLGYDRR